MYNPICAGDEDGTIENIELIAVLYLCPLSLYLCKTVSNSCLIYIMHYRIYKILLYYIHKQTNYVYEKYNAGCLKAVSFKNTYVLAVWSWQDNLYIQTDGSLHPSLFWNWHVWGWSKVNLRASETKKVPTYGQWRSLCCDFKNKSKYV